MRLFLFLKKNFNFYRDKVGSRLKNFNFILDF
jgi:hypothetical protein